MNAPPVHQLLVLVGHNRDEGVRVGVVPVLGLFLLRSRTAVILAENRQPLKLTRVDGISKGAVGVGEAGV